MASKLDHMLEPGERVVYRARQSVLEFFVRFLGLGAALGAFAYGLHFLGVWAAPELFRTPPHRLVSLLAVLLACLLLARGKALVTDRRLLVGRGLYRRHITQLPLSEVTEVTGLAEGSPRLVAVESAGGRALVLDELPKARQLGMAVAEAAGLPLPADPASVGERAARVLKAGGFWGALPEAAVAMMLPALAVDPGEPATLGAVVILLVPYLIFAVPVGLALGWVFGSLLVLVCLRPLVTAKEIEQALHTLQQMVNATSRHHDYPYDDLDRWMRPLRIRLAGIVYGRPMRPSADGAKRHVR